MKSQPASVSDSLLSVGRANDVAMIDAGGPHSYAELRRAVAAQTRRILDWDLSPGSRIGLLGANSFFWAASYLAIMHAGHTVVSFASVLTEEDILNKAAHVGCRSILIDQRLTRRFTGVARAMDRTLSSPTLEDDLAEARDDVLPPAQPAAAEAVLIFTSGTTSRPRAVRVSHVNILANTASITRYLDLRRDDRMLVVLPFSYCFGASLLHTHLSVGASVRLCDTQAFPETIVEGIAADGCTGLAGVPSSYQMLLRASTFESRPLPTLRLIQQAGGRLPQAQIQRIVAAQPQARMFVMYGQTEATARLAYLPPEYVAAKPGSVGRAIPGVQLRVTDESGNDLPNGTVGEIRARGDNITQGYWDDRSGTADKFVNGELRTGDLGRFDRDGFLYVVDRQADFIKSWGYRVSSHEVEDAVLELPDVATAAAVGRPDPDAGEAVVLFVTLRPNSALTTDDLSQHARRRLAKHLLPQEIRIIDHLPLNENGKVVKTELRKLAAVEIPELSV